MTRRQRDLRRALNALAGQHGCALTLERTSGGHLRARFTAGARHVDIVMAWSPSDWRAGRNAAAFVRRALREVV
jgi:hypothetical protein